MSSFCACRFKELIDVVGYFPFCAHVELSIILLVKLNGTFRTIFVCLRVDKLDRCAFLNEKAINPTLRQMNGRNLNDKS